MILGYIGTGVLYGGYIAARVVFGSCPNVELQKDFDLDAYLGTWY
jgi:lipocalin